MGEALTAQQTGMCLCCCDIKIVAADDLAMQLARVCVDKLV